MKIAEHEDQPGQPQSDLAVAGDGERPIAPATTTVDNHSSPGPTPGAGRPGCRPVRLVPTRAGAGLVVRLIVSARSRSSVVGDRLRW